MPYLPRIEVVLLLAVLLAGCSKQEDRPMMSDLPQLASLRDESKFEAEEWYTGADTPEDGVALTKLVNGTIDDIAALPRPLDRKAVRDRLKRLTEGVFLFATEDREKTYRYAVRIWLACGFTDETDLLSAPDNDIPKQ